MVLTHGNNNPAKEGVISGGLIPEPAFCGVRKAPGQDRGGERLCSQGWRDQSKSTI